MGLYRIFLEHIVLPFGDLLTGGSFISELKRLRKLMMLPEESLEALHEQKLRKVLRHAKEKVPYYKGIHIDELEQVKDQLKVFPIIDKTILRQETDQLISSDQDRTKLIKHSSSGSSGVQSTVYWSRKEQSIHRATQILWWEWAGYKIGDPILQTGINPKRTPIKRMKDFLFRTRYIQAFSHSKNEVINSLRWAEKKNAFLAGYASSLFVFAETAEHAGLQIHLKGAVSWGDKLFDHYRSAINRAFGVRVHETYASAEGLMIAAQCDLPYMYIMSPNIHIEILDDFGNEVPDGEMGHVLVTNLNAYSMPLIRYRIGDLGIKLPADNFIEKENRKIKLPVLQKVIGRDTDIVKTHTGKSLVVHSFTGIFEHIPQIRQFCVIQESLNGIHILLVPADEFGQHVIENVHQKLRAVTEPDFVIEFELVEEIPPTPSGKPQIIISRLPKAGLGATNPNLPL